MLNCSYPSSEKKNELAKLVVFYFASAALPRDGGGFDTFVEILIEVGPKIIVVPWSHLNNALR